MDGFGLFLIFLVLLNLDLIPTYIALGRDHYRVGSIFLVNLFIPIIGWVIALCWACGDPRSPQQRDEDLAMLMRYEGDLRQATERQSKFSRLNQPRPADRAILN